MKKLTAAEQSFAYLSTMLEEAKIPLVVTPEPSPRRSTVEHPVKKVFAICDEMKGKTRKEVIAACVAAGINKFTARTQYQVWFTAARNDAARSK